MEKLGSKVLPVVGGFVNLAFGYDRLAGGDTFGALIEMMAGVADIASIFPPLAPLSVLSTALDGYMFVRDMGPMLLGENFDIKAREDAIFEKAGLAVLRVRLTHLHLNFQILALSCDDKGRRCRAKVSRRN